jgi:hypothetical protein
MGFGHDNELFDKSYELGKCIKHISNTMLPDPPGLNAGSADPRFRSGSGSRKRQRTATCRFLSNWKRIPVEGDGSRAPDPTHARIRAKIIFNF